MGCSAIVETRTNRKKKKKWGWTTEGGSWWHSDGMNQGRLVAQWWDEPRWVGATAEGDKLWWTRCCGGTNQVVVVVAATKWGAVDYKVCRVVVWWSEEHVWSFILFGFGQVVGCMTQFFFKTKVQLHIDRVMHVQPRKERKELGLHTPWVGLCWHEGFFCKKTHIAVAT